MAIATASAAADKQATTTLAESVAPVTANNPGVGAVSGIESKIIPLSSVPDDTTFPTTTVSGPTVRTPASERATVRAGGAAAVAATSTAQGFLGIATELTTIPTLSGSAADPDTPFLHLLRNLSPGAPILLRLGGNSADDSWWAIPGMKKPPYLYTLSPRWGADVRALLKALGGKAILGVNLKESEPDRCVRAGQRTGVLPAGCGEGTCARPLHDRRLRQKVLQHRLGARAGSARRPGLRLTTLVAQAGHDAERHALAPEAGDGARLCDEELLAHRATVGVGVF